MNLNDLEAELNRHMAELERELRSVVHYCPNCGSPLGIGDLFCPECGSGVGGMEVPVPETDVLMRTSLTRYDDLEEDSKTKIGTFEKFIVMSGDFLTSDVSGESDFSQYVNLLSGVAELECNLSVYQLQRERHGIAMPRWYDVDFHGHTQKGREVELVNGRQPLGTLLLNLRLDHDFCKYLRKNTSVDVTLLMDCMEGIREPRNDASHGNVITKQRFREFYSVFCKFYDEVMPVLLQLKLSVRKSN